MENKHRIGPLRQNKQRMQNKHRLGPLRQNKHRLGPLILTAIYKCRTYAEQKRLSIFLITKERGCTVLRTSIPSFNAQKTKRLILEPMCARAKDPGGAFGPPPKDERLGIGEPGNCSERYNLLL
eukprot:1144734-Pelagomonas_calceolata.AAC.5